MRRPKVLFLSTENAARSQMAEAWLRSLAGDRFEVHSAGLNATAIHPLTVEVMSEAGISTKGQWAKDVSEYLGKVHFGNMITVCASAEQNCPTAFLGIGNRYYWKLDDPVKFQGDDAAAIAKFRAVRDQIEQLVRSWIDEQPNE
ncbi:MAG: arsenate reductase ArsC [Caldilineales bacterium]|nr:arsenate reductase ArsC [Caldilineales bacterium]